MLEKATIGYNMSYNRTIGCVPLELIGQKCLFKIDSSYQIAHEINKEEMLEKAKTQIQKYRKEYESLGNRGIKRVLKEGSLVWY